MPRLAEILQESADTLRAGLPLSEVDGERVANVIEEFIYTPSRSRDRLLAQEGRRERDEHLVELARLHCHDQPSIRAKVLRIIQIAHRYETSGWQRGDQHKAECPERIKGSPQEFIWHALKAGGKIPGKTQLHEILTRSKAYVSGFLPRD